MSMSKGFECNVTIHYRTIYSHSHSHATVTITTAKGIKISSILLPFPFRLFLVETSKQVFAGQNANQQDSDNNAAKNIITNFLLRHFITSRMG